MAVTDLTTTYATLSLGLTCTERGEVIVQQEFHIAMLQHIVNKLLVEFCTESTG